MTTALLHFGEWAFVTSRPVGVGLVIEGLLDADTGSVPAAAPPPPGEADAGDIYAEEGDGDDFDPADTRCLVAPVGAIVGESADAAGSASPAASPPAASPPAASPPAASPRDYLHDILLSDAHRAAFFDLVDTEGIVVCRNVFCDHPTYRFVRGRSSRGRLSQGEYYHHDGCSGPVKPRVVEIRFPHQATGRHVATAAAPFPDTVIAMVRELPQALLQQNGLAAWRARVDAGEALTRDEWDTLQGLITRVIRRELDAEQARAWFRVVDARLGAWSLPWQWGESRFIANNNPHRTFQHRRAYLEPASDGRGNGNLVKRWPAEEL